MSNPFAGDRIAEAYLRSHARIVELLRNSSAAQLAAPCNATPGWQARDVMSHLVGNLADGAAGRLRGMPTDEDTARQIAERQDRTLEEVIAEWAAYLTPVVEGLRNETMPVPLTMDVIVHEQDIRGAVGADRLDDHDSIDLVLTGFSGGIQTRLSKAGLPSLRLEAIDADWSAPSSSDAAVVARASRFDWFRALPGRRSRRQVSELEWTGDPAPYLDVLSGFGPLRETDVND